METFSIWKKITSFISIVVHCSALEIWLSLKIYATERIISPSKKKMKFCVTWPMDQIFCTEWTLFLGTSHVVDHSSLPSSASSVSVDLLLA